MISNINFQGNRQLPIGKKTSTFINPTNKSTSLQITAPAIAHPEKVRTIITGAQGKITSIECNVTLGPKIVDHHFFQNKKGITEAELSEICRKITELVSKTKNFPEEFYNAIFCICKK